MKNLIIILSLAFVGAGLASAQPFVRNNTGTPKIQIPDIPGYYTLKCDLHMHTVFSDGTVWPTVRVDEAVAEGLDAISITDHVELSHSTLKEYVKPDKVVGYEMAKIAVKGRPLIIIPGGELSITKDHFNALFITNQNDTVLSDKNPEIRIKAAFDQGGYVFWNHPGWYKAYKDGMAPKVQSFYDMMKSGMIKGLEIANGDEYYEECFEICEKYNLALLGNSDIHYISYYAYTPDDHRTITLVFSPQKTAEGIHEALLNRRTLVYQGEHLIGRDEFLEPLFKSCLQIETKYSGTTSLAVMTITNISDIGFYCENLGDLTFYNGTHFFALPAHSTTTLMVKTREILERFTLDLKVHNLIDGPRQSLKTTLAIEVLK
ncbi:MAG: hypothetical protein A2X22_06150 [Bacteroidetes bacterium GWF2_49_14]|nr:MAG: hypothetical protein A2X22_06150 [Bacteroidetes bacterium GWF2_49_14]HBB90676.1 hypothetical protein [Bacteroidales bacterium]